jgi:hypothetical protein
VNPVGPAVAGSNVAIEAALNKACNPHISEEEESEYAFYTTQFLDEYARPSSGDAASDAEQAGRVDGQMPLERTAALTDHHLIDEKDIQIYEEGVAVSGGKAAAVDRFVRYSTIDPVLVSHAHAASQLAFPVAVSAVQSGMATAAQGSQFSTGAGAAAVAQAAAVPSGLTASEAKIRAYTSWLSLGQTKLVSF